MKLSENVFVLKHSSQIFLAAKLQNQVRFIAKHGIKDFKSTVSKNELPFLLDTSDINCMKTKFLHLLCFEFLLFSGGVVTSVGHASLCMIIWALSCFLYYYSYHKKNEFVFRDNIKKYALIISWIFVVTFVINDPNADLSITAPIFYAIGVVFLCSIETFDNFRKTLLKCANILFLISIVVHLGHSFGIIPAHDIPIGGIPTTLSLYLFHTEWDAGQVSSLGIHRFSSVYWEPGQAQVVIMYILLLFTDDIKENLLKYKYILSKYGILILALILTQSSTGYLVFMLYFSCLLLFNNTIKKKKYLKPIFVLLTVLFAFLMFNSSVVQDKIDQRNEKSEDTSYAIRVRDNVVCYEIATENPLFGCGLGSRFLEFQLSKRGSRTSSNGWLLTGAQVGLPYLLFIFFCMFKRIKQMNLEMQTCLLLLILILSQCNEAFTYFPYIWIYVFKFKTYKRLK